MRNLPKLQSITVQIYGHFSFKTFINFDNNYPLTHWDEQSINIFITIQLALIESKKSNSRAVQYVIDLYKEYVDNEARENVGIGPLQPLLKQVTGEEQWPLIGAHPNVCLSVTEQKSNFENFKTSWTFWKYQLMNQYSDHDIADINQWMDCYVEVLMVGYQPLIKIKNWDTMSNAKLNATEIALVPFELSEKFEEMYPRYVLLKQCAMLLTGYDDDQHWNSSLDYVLFEVMAFEIKLSGVFEDEPKLSSNNLFAIISLGHLKRKYSSPNFDWTLLLNKYAARAGALFRFTDEHQVRINLAQLHLFEQFTWLLTQTSIRVLQNQIGLHFLENPSLLTLIDATEQQVVDNKALIPLIFSHPGITFVIKNFNMFDSIFMRLYLDYVGRQKMLIARDQVFEMARHLKETLSDSLKNDYAWLGERTRKRLIDKLEDMRIEIAFFDWIFDDAALDENYGFSKSSYQKDSQHLAKGEYITSFINFQRLMTGAEMRQIDQIPQKDRENYFSKYNAAYSGKLNLIVISYALLSEPWYNADYPAAINSGNMGYIIAHEMMHAFDHKSKLSNIGRGKAKERNEEHFEMLSNCFVKQYEGLVEPSTGIKINGTVKLVENIADNGALNQAYRAFEKYLKYSQNTTFEMFQSFRVQFTPEQLFFVSYSTNWCCNGQNSTEKAEYVWNDPHSPNRFRVNIPLSNMAQFAKAFNCPVGSPMNPKHKCSIW